MCTLKAHFQCYDRFFEVYPNEVEHNELILENIFSQLLISFFEEVMVDVSIHFLHANSSITDAMESSHRKYLAIWQTFFAMGGAAHMRSFAHSALKHHSVSSIFWKKMLS